MKTGITPRQTIFAICTRLASNGRVSRLTTHQCHACSKFKHCTLARTGVVAPMALTRSGPTETFANDHPWYWEGNVQASLSAWLVGERWRLISLADTASKAPGVDVVATRESAELWISVKGYPAASANTAAPTQARHWFSHAIFDLVMYRDRSPTVSLALGLPEIGKTYRSLASRVSWLKRELPFSIYWVSETNGVRVE